MAIAVICRLATFLSTVVWNAAIALEIADTPAPRRHFARRSPALNKTKQRGKKRNQRNNFAQLHLHPPAELQNVLVSARPQSGPALPAVSREFAHKPRSTVPIRCRARHTATTTAKAAVEHKKSHPRHGRAPLEDGQGASKR